MYLSRLLLNLRNRSVHYQLADRYELHRTVMSGFSDDLANERILFRVEIPSGLPYAMILIQSQQIPEWQNSSVLSQQGFLFADIQIREIAPQYKVGQLMPFRLQANPTIKRAGKRHALYRDEQLLDWLNRKGKQGGFMVESINLRITQLGKIFGKQRQQIWAVVQFDGILTITHSNFERALKDGVGSAKAFGFGLLSIPYG